MVERETRHGKNGWIFTARRESDDFDERSSNDQIRVDFSVRSSRDIREGGLIDCIACDCVYSATSKSRVCLIIFV